MGLWLSAVKESYHLTTGKTILALSLPLMAMLIAVFAFLSLVLIIFAFSTLTSLTELFSPF